MTCQTINEVLAEFSEEYIVECVNKAALSQQDAVGEITRDDMWCQGDIDVQLFVDDLPAGTKLYTHPQPQKVRACTECGDDREGIALHCVACLNKDGWYLTSEPAQKIDGCDCGDKSQCWEPCGELGHSEEHVRVSDVELPEFPRRILRRSKRGLPLPDEIDTAQVPQSVEEFIEKNKFQMTWVPKEEDWAIPIKAFREFVSSENFRKASGGEE